MWLQHQIEITTKAKSSHDITYTINAMVEKSHINRGLCHLFLQHTSASLILCENADPDVRYDLEAYFRRLVPDGDPRYRHAAEGPDDMAAHIRTILTDSSLSIPITNSRLVLGQWQGIYLWEHRNQGYDRQLLLTLQGD